MKIVEIIVLALLVLYCPSSKMISPKTQLLVNCTGKHLVNKEAKNSQRFNLYFQEWSSFSNPDRKCLMAFLPDSAPKNHRCGLGPDQVMKVNYESYPLGFMVVHIYNVTEHNLGTFQCTQTINADHGEDLIETYVNSTVKFGLTEARCQTNCTFSDNFGYLTLTLISFVDKQDCKPDTLSVVPVYIQSVVNLVSLSVNIFCCVQYFKKKFAPKRSYAIASTESVKVKV